MVLLALGGLWVPALASLSLVASPLAHGALLVNGVRLVARLWRRLSPWRPLLGFAAAVCAEVSLAVLMFGVPPWVKDRAAPALAALEDWKRTQGRYPEVDALDPAFPEPIRARLFAAGCPLYSPAGADFELTCSGVAFTKCTYVASTVSWRGWD